MLGSHRRSLSGWFLPALVAAAGVFIVSAVANAQGSTNYKQAKTAPDLRDPNSLTFKNLKKAKTDIVRGRAPLNANLDSFKRWYEGYFFPSLTQISELSNITNKRKELIKDIEDSGLRAQDVHQALVDLALKRCKVYASADCHPAVRHNAMLIIGDLNDREAQLSGQSRKPPVPYPQALYELLLAVDDKDAKQIDAVKVAALWGIKRHVYLRTTFQDSGPISSKEQKTTAQLMLKLVRAAEPPAGRTREGHDWMRREALDILGLLDFKAARNTLIKTCLKLVGDDQTDLSVRCAAARAMGQIDFSEFKINPGTWANPLVALAAHCCQVETSRLDELIALDATSGDDGELGPGAGLISGDEGLDTNSNGEPVFADERTKPVRRRLMQRLDAIQLGLRGDSQAATGVFALAKSDQHKRLIKNYIDLLGEIADVLGDSTLDVQKLSSDLTQKSTDLKQLLNAAQPTATTARAEPDTASPSGAPQ